MTGSRAGRRSGGTTGTRRRTSPSPSRGLELGGRILGVYLLLTAPLLLAQLVGGGSGGAPSPTVAGILLIHLGLGSLLAGGWPDLPRGSSAPPRAADLLPFLAFPLLYWEVPLLNQVLVEGFRDPIVVAWEARWFGDPTRTLASRWPWLWLSEALHLAYLGGYLLVAVSPLWLFVRQNGPGLRALGVGTVLAWVPPLLVHPFLPVEGPRYSGAPPDIPAGPVRELVLGILEAGSARGTAFPSLLTAAALSASLVLVVVRPRLGLLAVFLVAAMGAGAVYGGFHYAVDVVAGGCAGVVGGSVGGWLAWRSGGCTPPRRR